MKVALLFSTLFWFVLVWYLVPDHKQPQAPAIFYCDGSQRPGDPEPYIHPCWDQSRPT